MAETLVEELLRKSGNAIYRFGYEAILQNLTQLERSFDGDGYAGKRIRAIPDFIVVDKEGKPTFLEVKFRWNGELHQNDHDRLQRIKDFWNAKIVIVNCLNKPYFQISFPPYFNQANEFASRPLSQESPWTIDQNRYKESEDLVEKYLRPTLLKEGKENSVD